MRFLLILPDHIIADISELQLGNKLIYSLILKATHIHLLHPDNTVVCQVRTSRASILEDAEEVETEETETEETETEAAE